MSGYENGSVVCFRVAGVAGLPDINRRRGRNVTQRCCCIQSVGDSTCLVFCSTMPTTDSTTRTAATAAAGNIHTGMEEEHPVFGCCPFSGVYCRLCQKSITTEGTTAQAMNMFKHITSKAHLDNCCDDQLATVTTQDKDQQSAFVALAKTKLLPIAEKLSKALKMKKNAEDARLILAPFLNPSSVSYYCRHC
jgi:hypothetical protein